jgi:hypothetical protein
VCSEVDEALRAASAPHVPATSRDPAIALDRVSRRVVDLPFGARLMRNLGQQHGREMLPRCRDVLQGLCAQMLDRTRPKHPLLPQGKRWVDYHPGFQGRA